MLASPLLLIAPLLFFPATSALPEDVNLGSGEDVKVHCQALTVTETVYLPAPTNTTTREGVETVATASVPERPPNSPTTTATNGQTTPGNSKTTSCPDQTSPSGSTTSTCGNRATQYQNALYFTNWGIYGANYQPQALPADTVTHVLYAFADIAPNGEVKSSDSYADLEKHYSSDLWNETGRNAYGCVKQLYLLKKKHRRMKTQLSIGGWTYSHKFAPVAATEDGRQRFCNSSVTILKDWGFDGLDIDWEYPSDASQAADYVRLLRTCRQALDAYAAQHAPGYHFLLTIAAPAGPQNYRTMALRDMDQFLDAWHIMAYDYAGSWDNTTGHQSNLFPSPANPIATKFSTDRAVRDYVAAGIPAHKLILGMPLYGRAFEKTKGPGQNYTGIGEGSTQSGIWLYKDLPRAGAREMYDPVAGASYSFDGVEGGLGELVSYDTVGSAEAKVEYLVGRGLGGAVFWEASGDKAEDASLVRTVARGMGSMEQTENWLEYPTSQYENIRMGLPG